MTDCLQNSRPPNGSDGCMGIERISISIDSRQITSHQIIVWTPRKTWNLITWEITIWRTVYKILWRFGFAW